jgi:homopolymeric O-antigen transport system ATP-binding protein
MSEPVIAVENLGKRYRIYHATSHQPYATLRDVLASTITAPLRLMRRRRQQRSGTEDFWALKEVSFEVRNGDVLGIIGANGAGKTTLLKVLSRITDPTEGRVTLEGRVASLLEVGTGFHPELTGRENIFLNGAILGMTRAEITRKFDEIVSFAEVEQFLDTPVKRYSSGMYVRLAFAVAAHLEPEILIVDEVLAVGDAQFQKKSLGRMNEVAAGGRTVLFVSHNMHAVESLCTAAIHLEHGRLTEYSKDVRAVIARHLRLATGDSRAPSVWLNQNNAFNNAVMQPTYFAVETADRQPLHEPARGDTSLFVVIRANVKQLDPALRTGFVMFNQDSQHLLSSFATDGPEATWPQLEIGEVEIRCPLPRRLLNEGTYRLELNCSLQHREWIAQPGHNSPSIYFTIRGGFSDSPNWLRARQGLIAPEWRWERTR